MKVMVVTQSENIAVAPVIQALQSGGGEVFRFDTDLYPTAYRLSVWQGASGPRSILECADYTLDLHQLGAIWFETVEAAYHLPTMEPDVRAVVLRETAAVVDGLGSTLDAFQLDPVLNRDGAYSKLRQHRLATEVGLEIPRTLVTNDADAVRSFFRDCPGGLITKMHKRFVRIVDVNGQEVTTEQVTPTPVTEADLHSLDGLHLCPMIFQEEVPKKVELRVMVVGHQVFTAELDSQAMPATRYSWQNDQYANDWRPSELPERVAAKVRDLLTRLGLNYSACDLIRTPDDRYVFLELNARGKYVLVEETAGLRVSEAIADLLLGRTPRRV
jgi:hypothetical protein